ncbi:MAG: hypothetical protein K1000chlam3_01673 [Chlamydiae bacterium]|nr:hypothetical protein [Chlamydiota bacterium]
MNILRSESFPKNATLTLAGAVVGYLASESWQGAVAGAMITFSSVRNDETPAIKTTVVATTFFSCAYFATEQFIPKPLSLLAGVFAADFYGKQEGMITYALFASCLTKYVSSESLAILTSLNLIEKFTEVSGTRSGFLLALIASACKGCFVALNAWQGHYIESASFVVHSISPLFSNFLLGASLGIGYKTLQSDTFWHIPKTTRSVATNTFQWIEENQLSILVVSLAVVAITCFHGMRKKRSRKSLLLGTNEISSIHLPSPGRPRTHRSNRQQPSSRERAISQPIRRTENNQRANRQQPSSRERAISQPIRWTENNQRANRRQSNSNETKIPKELENDETLQPYLCKIGLQFSLDPVLDPTNFTTIYDRENILEWLKTKQISPITKKTLSVKNLISLPKVEKYIASRIEKPNDEPNEELKKAAEEEYKQWTELSIHFNGIDQLLALAKKNNSTLPSNLDELVLSRIKSDTQQTRTSQPRRGSIYQNIAFGNERFSFFDSALGSGFNSGNNNSLNSYESRSRQRRTPLQRNTESSERFSDNTTTQHVNDLVNRILINGESLYGVPNQIPIPNSLQFEFNSNSNDGHTNTNRDPWDRHSWE